MYQGPADHCEGDCNPDVIFLLQPYLTIHYCNQSVLVIVPDLNIFVWVITTFISFWEAPWYSTFILHASYLYNSMGTEVLQCLFVTILASPWSPLSQVSALYYYYENMVFRFMLPCLVFDHIVGYFVFTYVALTHSDEQQPHIHCGWHHPGWVYYVVLQKIQL